MSGARPFYDLTTPTINLRDMAQTGRLDDPSLTPAKTVVNSSENDLEAYAHRLLRLSTDLEEPDDDPVGGCMTAVEIVTRSSGKGWFLDYP